MRSRRRNVTESLQLIVNLGASVVLVETGWKLFGQGRPVFAAVSLAAVAALAVATVRGVLGATANEKIGWANLFAGAVMLLTVVDTAIVGADDISRASVANGVILISVGFLHGRIRRRAAHRFSLRLDETGVDWRVSRWRRIRAAWEDISGLAVVGNSLVMTTNGHPPRRIGLKDVVNCDEVLAALGKHAAAHGIDIKNAINSEFAKERVPTLNRDLKHNESIKNATSVGAFLMAAAGLVYLVFVHHLFATSPVFIAVQVVAVALMLWARLTFGGRSFHASARPTKGGLITTGPYRYWRHPIYAAVIYFVWAGQVDLPAPWPVVAAVVVSVGLFVRMIIEETFLRAEYADYVSYSNRAKRVIPFLF